ncbi:biopolymer transport protein ExbD/TolR [Klebsiella pneumoniae]|nr:biopolymer transport protein ExbD/TolR [Klebsiella pneumoniae]
MAMRLNENLDDNGEMHEINVTPFIDVMLVLLIIFMVAAPLATVDVKVNLPASSSQPQPRPEKPIYLSVKADKSMFLGNDPVTEANMINALDSLTAGKKDTTVFFRADKTVDYETMMKVMDTLHQAGYLKDRAGGRRDRQSEVTSPFPLFSSGWPCASFLIGDAITCKTNLIDV